MADSKGQKRIFTARGQTAALDLARTPSCYYHKCAITHFCVKKKCTLPLCQQCLSIHKRQHINNKEIPNEGILEFETARDDALSAFQQRKEEIEKAQERFRAKVSQYKQKMVELITGLLDKFMEDALVTDGNLEIIAEIEERTSEISRGSLKELIRYYEDIYGAEHFRKLYKMYTGEYLTNFKFELDKKKLQKLTKDGIKNMNFLNQQAKINQESNLAGAVSFPPNSPIKESLPVPEKDETKPKDEIIKHIPGPQKIQAEPLKQKMEKYEPRNSIDVKNKRIQSEQQEQSEISSYQLLKSKKKIEQGNIYTQKPSKLTQNYSQNPSSNVSTSKSKRKKGLSLAKSHKELPTLQSSESSNFLPSKCEEEKSENNNRRSNWRQFVNMKETHPENDNMGVPLSEPTTVLNPKQMRELIVKKKMEEKQKELKANRSTQLLAQPDRIKY